MFDALSDRFDGIFKRLRGRGRLSDKDVARFLHAVLQHEVDPREFVRGSDARITDDRPFNEYYLLRRLFSPFAPTPGTTAHAALDEGQDVESRSAP